jgi:bifunctional UDP-N-acetylglucosamine pyrophosphorylase/glucosamine-1-phosphate N-acetyltransferase
LDKYGDEDNVLILNGDMPAIQSKTLKQFLTASTSHASLLVAEIDNPFGYGRVITANYGDGDEIMYIREEKDCNEEERKVRLVNVGIYLFRGSVLKKYIPLIDCVNKQNEYYLTKIVKLINVHIDDKRENDIKITPFLIHPSKNHEILGVNTQEELTVLGRLFSPVES